MDDTKLKKIVADTGRELLKKGLVARTWGNISVRRDEKSFAISPSGLGYVNMTPADVPIYDMEKEEWEGTRKPSSEKKIHAAAYKIFPDVNAVIHTHQDYATAVGLAGTDLLELTEEEQKLLGKIEIAGYGLPGTGKLKKNVEAAYLKGSKVVLMSHHGAVILGQNMDDAIKKAEALENVCRRAVIKKIGNADENVKAGRLSPEMLSAAKDMRVVTDNNTLWAAEQNGFKAELDDIAQMLGQKLKCVENDDAAILKALNHTDAVLVRGVGCVILTEDPDDAEALMLLTKKACMTHRLISAAKKHANLSAFDCKLMNAVYKMKYSKKKEG